MKQGLNLAMLLKEEKITQFEFERYLELSKEDIPNYVSDALIGVGFILISYGIILLNIDSPSGAMETARLVVGLFNIGLGFFLESNRILLTTICFVLGPFLILVFWPALLWW
jgi:uncharacterized membrane protein